VLFLLAVDGLPLSQKKGVKGGLSLSALLRDDETARLTALVFNVALARHRIGGVKSRELAQTILGKWIERRHRETEQYQPSTSEKLPDAVFRLARFLAATAESSEDVDRVAYMFESLYSPEALRDRKIADSLH
jgi:hypothetical protein